MNEPIKLYIDQESSCYTGEKLPEHCGQKFVSLTPEAVEAIAEAVAKKMSKTTLPESYTQTPTPFDTLNDESENVMCQVIVTERNYMGFLEKSPPVMVPLNIEEARKQLEKESVQSVMAGRGNTLEKVEVSQYNGITKEYMEPIAIYERKKNENQ
jgi:hypothetical protein